MSYPEIALSVNRNTGGVSTHYGVPSINASPDHGSAATESTSILVTEIDDRLWPSPTPDSSAIDAADSNVDGQGNRDNRASDLALSDINTNMTSHASYPMSTFDSNPLLDLDDLQANSFPRDTGARAFESRQTWTTNDTTCPSRKAFQVPPRALPMPYFKHLFQTAERFLDALQGYVGIGLDTSDAMHMADAGQNTHTQIDVATGLMIYVLHLLERISEVVDGAVASRQPYSRAVTEIQKIEAKLKERVLATLH
ncbi:hypothetical protein GGS26DRAFT_592373 [Hypomontagnella submonticulosa]|nr:hypothetical protein GGS26DRAFT_592373 [Hypomontagnella submonticulosa]